MSEGYSRRDFLAGVLVSGTLSAAALYLAPGGRPPPSVSLTLLTGTDSTGARQLLVDMWNQANPDTTVNLKLVTGSTVDQRNEMIVAAESGTADILNLDIIEIPYFASRDLITPFKLEDVPVFVAKTLTASRMADDPTRFWAVPFNTDVGMLFERLSGEPAGANSPEPPMAAALDRSVADGSHQFVGQLRPLSSSSDEVFLVNVFEHALSRDDGILDDEGIPAYDLGRWQHALRPLRTAMASNRITESDTDNDSRQAFRTRRLRYMRHWPVNYRKLQQESDPDVQAARVRVGPLPIGILGGQSLALVTKSAHAKRAVPLIRYLTDEPSQKILAAHGLVPARSVAYSDPNLTAFIPYLEQMRGAVEEARPRPIHRNYSQFSEAVVRHMKNLLQRDIELPSQFIDEMRAALA